MSDTNFYALRKLGSISATSARSSARVERGERGVGGGEAGAAMLDQRPGVTGLELGVELHRQGVSVPGEHSERAERAVREHSRAGRSDRHPVLVRDRDGDPGRRVLAHPGRPGDDLVILQAGRPAALRFLDPAAERLGHRLVAEADPDQLRLALRLAQESEQRRDPGQRLVDSGRRAGDQESGMGVGGRRQLARAATS